MKKREPARTTPVAPRRPAAKWWHALKGAAAWITCARADSEVALERARTCAQCPTRVLMRDSVLGKVVRWVFGRPTYYTCGPELDPKDGERCGCVVLAEAKRAGPGLEGLVILSIGGLLVPMEPAGKANCKGEKCPQGRWKR